MKGIKAKLNIDKLTICYTASEETIAILQENNFIDYDSFQLIRYNDTKKLFNDCFLIRTKDIDENEGGTKWIEYATLRFNMRLTTEEEEEEERKNYVWLYFTNRTLYRPMYPDVSIITEAEYITDILKLKINNITSLDIAFDSNINTAKHIKKAVFSKKLDVILNGHMKSNPKEVLDEILYIQKGNQIRMTDLSVYVKQKKTGGFELCCYDKTKEAIIGKPYILKWMATQQNVYRAEIRLKSVHLREYFNKLHEFKLDLILTHLNDKEFLFNMFIHFANRLIRFRDKSNNIYSILEV